MREKNNYKKGRDITIIGSIINGILIIIKIGGGIIGHSSAIIADGIHSFSDFVSDIIVLSGLKLSSKPCDESHDFGHGKFETFSSFFLGIFLFFAGLAIFFKGINDIFFSTKGNIIEKPSLITLLIAFISIILKEYLYRATKTTGEITKSNLIIANAWHHRTDAISSLGIFLGIAGAILLGDKWRFLDPLSAVILSIFIIFISFKIIKDSFNELVEASLDMETENKILYIINSVKGANSPHNLKTRRIGNRISIDVHIKVSKNLNISEAHLIATKVEKNLKNKFGEQTFVSIHIEPDNN